MRAHSFVREAITDLSVRAWLVAMRCGWPGSLVGKQGKIGRFWSPRQWLVCWSDDRGISRFDNPHLESRAKRYYRLSPSQRVSLVRHQSQVGWALVQKRSRKLDRKGKKEKGQMRLHTKLHTPFPMTPLLFCTTLKRGGILPAGQLPCSRICSCWMM